ncbi:HAD family hydrolase [candidate division KSB1 bacterium]
MMIKIYPGVKGLIFDCDGTLVDSMPLHMKAWKRAFNDFGEDCPDKFLNPLKGMHEEEIVELYNERFNKNIDSRRLVELKHRCFQEDLADVKPIKPVVDIVMKYHVDYPMAVVSGGTFRNVSRALEIAGIINYFKVILTADDPIRPKPAPDIFIEAAKRINVEPGFCQVFEDGELGLKAAEQAGMYLTDIRDYI